MQGFRNLSEKVCAVRALGAAVQSKTSPYADASVKYAYAPGGAFQVGVRHQLNPTDIAVDSTGGIVQSPCSTSRACELLN